MRAKHLICVGVITIVVVLGLNTVAYAGWWETLTNTRAENSEVKDGATVAVRG